jgi:dethiobiotin synthetase
MAKQFFITGIGTDVGKTIVSAILAEALQADYWKPIQAGNIESSDTMMVANLVTNPVTEVHPPAYSFEMPASPHFAAEKEGVHIELDKIKIPVTKNHFIIEGAGGIMVPLNKKERLIDLMIRLQIPVILVVRNYLGGINHAILSYDALVQKKIPVAGIIYNGGNRTENIAMIENFTGATTLGIIPELEVVNKQTILTEAAKFASLKTSP